MKLSEKQAQMLFMIAQDTLNICGVLAFTQSVRQQIVEQILNQQSDELKEIGEE